MLEKPNGEVKREEVAAFRKRSHPRGFRRSLVIDSTKVAFRQLIVQIGFVDEELRDAGDLVGQLIRKQVKSVHLLREITFDHNQLLH